MTEPFPEYDTRLLRVISLPWLILYGLGSTIGAGIYALTGAVAGRAGMLAPVSFAIAALLALSTALSFAEFSARFPHAGGALVYVREGFASNRLSILVGLLSATAGIVSAATVSLGFVGYLSELLAIPSALALLLVVGGVGGIAAWGVRASVITAGVITLIEVLGLFAILLFGAHHIASSPSEFVVAVTDHPTPVEWSAVLGAAVIGFYAYLGFEDMVNVAEEVQDVRKVLPKAILWTLGLSSALYVCVATVAVLVVPASELAASPAPLSLVFDRSGGSARLLSLVALIAMLNGALVQVVMASRILFSLARSGDLPRWLSAVHPKRRTPLAATLCVSLAVGLLAIGFPLESLAAATASIVLGVFAIVNLALVVLLTRESRTNAAARRRHPIWIPLVGSLFSVAFLVFELTTRFGPWLHPG